MIDNWTRQRRGESFFGSGTVEERGVYPLKAHVKHKVVVEFCNVRGPADGDEDEPVMDRYPSFSSKSTSVLISRSNPGVRLGGAQVDSPDELMDKAVSLAKEADVVIAVVGLNADWETEGYDRTTLALPGRTDELIEKVAAVNSKIIVVTQSVGRPFSLTAMLIASGVRHSHALGLIRP